MTFDSFCGILAQMPTLSGPASDGWMSTLIIFGLIVLALLGVSYQTRAGIVARATTKEAVRQPIFILLLGLGAVILLINTVLPFFSLGDDVKMLKDCGLATILISGVVIAVWTSSMSIAEEIQGKTAMTLLSKPINRRQFVIGKYVGILQTVLILMTVLIVIFLPLIYYKVGYDARESSKLAPDHAERMAAVLQVIPGLLLIFLETAVLSAVSVAISTRLPMVANIVTCGTIYVVGHLTPVLANAKDVNEFVQFTAQLIGTILPMLEVFNISAAVATDTYVPWQYLASSILYCGAYCTAAILLAFILFEDRDLA